MQRAAFRAVQRATFRAVQRAAGSEACRALQRAACRAVQRAVQCGVQRATCGVQRATSEAIHIGLMLSIMIYGSCQVPRQPELVQLARGNYSQGKRMVLKYNMI